METVNLTAQARTKIGGLHSKRLRKEDLIPAVVYGQGIKPVSIQVVRGELEHALHTGAGENVLINLQIDDPSIANQTVILKEVQHDHVHDFITHVDFMAISLTEKVQVKVHLHLKGEAQGVKDGGILDMIHHVVEVECLPTAIPERITINVTDLKIGDSIHVSDLVLPEGVECLEEPETSLIVLLAPRAEEEEGSAEALLEGETASAEPEVIKKGKEDSEEPAE